MATFSPSYCTSETFIMVSFKTLKQHFEQDKQFFRHGAPLLSHNYWGLMILYLCDSTTSK